MRLSPRDIAALQRTILELYAYRDLETFFQAVPNLFLKIIPSEYFGLIELDVDMPSGVMKARRTWESAPKMTPDIIRRMEQHGGVDHPFTEYTAQSGDPSALKISDFLSVRQFRDTELYCEFYRHARIVRLLAVGIPGGSSWTTLNATRGPGDRDFTDRDRQIMNLLRPHFAQARRNAELATARLAAQSQPLEAYGLTPREREVAHWLSLGKSNPEIAIILGAGLRTVHKHVENILGKMGVENRTAAAVIISQANGT